MRRATVSAGDQVDDREPETRARARARRVTAGEGLEGVLDETGREPWALDLDVPMAPLAGILPLTNAKDSYIDAAVSGMTDPDQALLGDATRPLVFYTLEAPLTLALAKTATGAILLRF